MNQTDFLGQWFKHYGTHRVKSLFRGGNLGETWVRAVLQTACWCDRENDKKWHTVLMNFYVETEAYVRTHIAARESATKKGKQPSYTYVPRPTDLVDGDVAHENLHVEHYKAWHDTSEPEVKRDFDFDTHVFDTKPLCEEYRTGKLKKWRKSWWDTKKDELIRHKDFDNDPSSHQSGVTHQDTPGGYIKDADDYTEQATERHHVRFWSDVFE